MSDHCGEVKTFVLDTNVLLHSSASVQCFKDNDVVIPMAVIEELDKFKKNSDELGRNARRVIRYLDRLREEFPGCAGDPDKGLPLSSISQETCGKLFVISAGAADEASINEADRAFDNDLLLDSPDNRILRVACFLRNRGRNVIFISKDINLRLKADALGLPVMDFERQKVKNFDRYTGFQDSAVDGSLVDEAYSKKELPGEKFPDLPDNGFILLTSNADERKSVVMRKHAGGNLLMLPHRVEKVWNLSPRNKEQRMALDLLLDPEVKLVTLLGGAGTGKTLLALAAALQQTLHENIYEKILVSRPIIPLGNDIGFLPGSKESKLSSWMQPIFDNLEFLLGGEEERKPKSSSRYSTEGLMNSHKLDLEALTYIRGRSIPRQFIIIDEAQNLTPHEVKTIISRCGSDSKMVLTGDPAQIDNPYLDASGNGLSYAADRLKGESIFGHVTLQRSERSELAALAAKKL
ncbi:MAG: PhoH family protein [Lentisphaerae bacterium]|nr:PhoH family protein [Lentisphaerota bacterium]